MVKVLCKGGPGYWKPPDARPQNHLQMAVCSQSPHERYAVLTGPFSTDWVCADAPEAARATGYHQADTNRVCLRLELVIEQAQTGRSALSLAAGA
jgi:hypothetical protein